MSTAFQTAWPSGSRQEWAAEYLDQPDARAPFRKAMDDALRTICDGNGYGSFYFVDRAKFIFALEQMIDAALTHPAQHQPEPPAQPPEPQ